MNWNQIADSLYRSVAAFPAAKDMLDMQAQLDMAFWAKWMFWATIGSLGLSLIAVVAAYLSLRASRQAARESREVGEFQTQAYVHVSNAKPGSQGIIITCKNSGLTPATHFAVHATAKIVSRGNVSSSISFPPEAPFKIWSALGANDEVTVGILDRDPVVLEFLRQNGSADDILLVSGEVTYCTIFNHDHVTQFAFYAERKTSGRFRRPTANLVTFWRVPPKIPLLARVPVPVLLDENDD